MVNVRALPVPVWIPICPSGARVIPDPSDPALIHVVVLAAIDAAYTSAVVWSNVDPSSSWKIDALAAVPVVLQIAIKVISVPRVAVNRDAADVPDGLDWAN